MIEPSTIAALYFTYCLAEATKGFAGEAGKSAWKTVANSGKAFTDKLRGLFGKNPVATEALKQLESKPDDANAQTILLAELNKNREFIERDKEWAQVVENLTAALEHAGVKIDNRPGSVGVNLPKSIFVNSPVTITVTTTNPSPSPEPPKEAQPTANPIKAAVGAPPHNNLAAKNYQFAGREKDLAKIQTSFEQAGDTSGRRQVLTGLGGVGKSAIALKYAHDAVKREDYDYVWWMKAEDAPSIMTSCKDFIVEQRIIKNTEGLGDGDIKRMVRQWLGEHRSWLLVFDNAEKAIKEILEEILPIQQNRHQHALLTSRQDHWKDMTMIPLDVFSEEDSRKFLKKHCPEQKSDDGLDELAKALGHLALALEQAAAYININLKGEPKPYDAYLEIFQESPAPMLGEYPGLSDKERKQQQIVATTWQTSLAKIINPAAQQLLYICAFLDADNIQLCWFREARAALPEPLQTALATRYACIKLTEDICDYSMAKKEKDALSLHRLVQAVIKDQLAEERQTWLGHCLLMLNEYVNKHFPNAVSMCILLSAFFDDIPEFQALAPHITAAAKSDEAKAAQPEALAALCFFIGRGYCAVASYEDALLWNERSWEIRKEILGERDEATLLSLVDMTDTLHAMRKYDEAYLKLVATEKIQIDMGREQTALTARIYNLMAAKHIRAAIPDYDEALRLREKSYSIRLSLWGEDHPETCESLNDIGFIYDYKGDTDRAVEWYQKSLDIREKKWGEQHPFTATAYHNLGGIYNDTQRYREALELRQRALSIREVYYGTDHPATAIIYHNIARTHTNLKEYEKALKFCNKAISIRESKLGADNRTTAISYHLKAAILDDLRDYGQALEFFLKAYKVRKDLGENAKAAETLEAMQATYAKTGKPQPFDEWLRQALASSTPPRQPNGDRGG